MYLLLYVLTGAIMLALAFWQLSRAAEKIEWQEAADIALQAEPLVVAKADQLPENDQRYVRVVLTGRFESHRQFLWDNRIHNGRVGYEVVTPFRLTNGQLILVNRGWLVADPRREILPNLDFQAAEMETIIGILTRPSIGFSSGPAVETVTDRWPKRLQHFASAEISAAMEEPVLAGLVQDIVPEAQFSVPMYNNNWSPVSSGPERHYGYAFQWFAMFAGLTVLFFYLNMKKDSDKKDPG